MHITFLDPLCIAMETMHYHLAQTGLFLGGPCFVYKGFLMNNLAPMKKLFWGRGCAR